GTMRSLALKHRGLPTRAGAPGLRLHQGRHRHLHQGARAGPDSAGHQGQRGGTGAGVDAADPGHHARRAGHAVRRLGVPHRAPGPAGRAGAALRLPRLPGVELRQRRGSGRHRRRAALL
ncbi:MAG: hypothetical protein AVDCRST_MAG55-1685, partial [uncultured Rubrobacteraceae bacterium]